MLDNTWRNIAAHYCATETKEAMLNFDFPPRTHVHLLLLCSFTKI
jgi:hypothetical protein